MISYKSHLLYFSIFFTIFYIEILSIAGIKIAVIWKLALLIFIIMYIFQDKGKSNIKKFVFFGYLYSLKNFFTLSSFANLIESLTEAIKSSYIVLLFHFFIILNRNRNINLYKILLSFSIYIILSSIPFLLNIISPLGKGYDLSIFGIEEQGFVGIFQVPSSAAVTIAFALLVLIYHLSNKPLSSKNKLLLVMLILLGLWIEIQTFARTGFAIVIVAGGYLFLYKKSFKFYLKLIIPFLIFLGILFSYYNSSKAFQMRINGTNIYLEKSQTETDGGSGRLKFSKHAIENWLDKDIEGLWIGLGTELAKDMMKEDVGLRIYAHNGFVDTLQFNGLIGVLLYLMFLFFVIKFIYQNKHHTYYKLNIAILYGYLISMLFQGEHYFMADVIFALSLSLLYIEEKGNV